MRLVLRNASPLCPTRPASSIPPISSPADVIGNAVRVTRIAHREETAEVFQTETLSDDLFHTMTLDWQRIASVDFKVDGALRDIYVLGATDADWNKVLDEVRKMDRGSTYREDHKIVELPQRVEDVFERGNTVATLLSFRVGTFQINCHFFRGADIEFDLDPRDMTHPDDLESLATFMRLLAGLTKKRVLLTPENSTEFPILQCSPDTGQVIWIPRGHDND